ncbi:MAG TPA: oligoendopeptidase F [Candidatus Saccharimonadales bacterium]|nr:oligoendopeptidase F [Candidatus Saccharimonadales bacterium]
MKRLLAPAALLVLISWAGLAAAQGPAKVPQRSDIDPRYKWKLEDMYPTDDAWQADFKRLEEMIPRSAAFKGKVGESAASLLAALQLRDSLGLVGSRLGSYASMRRDQDTRVPKYQGMSDRMMGLNARLRAAGAFFEPEVVAIEPARLEQFLKDPSVPGLAVYRHELDDIQRTRAHVLPKEEEELLARSSEMASASGAIFSAFNNADLRFGTIKDETGADMELTKGRFARCLESPDRRVRRDAFWAMNSAYARFNNTLGACMNANVKRDLFYSRARKYGSALEGSLDPSNIPVSVYQNLVKTVNANLAPLHRYAALRKKWMGLDTLKVYDLYTPLVPAAKVDVPFELAKKEVVAGLKPLGDTYLAQFQKGLESGWIDVYETQGKTSGAYSGGTPTVHPYVLLNYSNTLEDEFTLAHEMGHSMHSFFTWKTQPPVYAGYSLFVAEVASTGNEALLINYLLKQPLDKQRRMFLLNHYLEQIRTTFYRQTLFAEFEMRTHEMAEAGQPLTAEAMNKLYRELFQRYYGPDLDLDSLADYEWSRVPHFYRSFYVYQYATSYAAATALSQKILNEGQPAVDRYLAFLKAGNSAYPIDVLKTAGVDMTTPAPIEATCQKFSELLDEMEKLWESK